MAEKSLSIHPYRKRKFFFGLAELFNEPEPTFQRIQDVFQPLPLDHGCINTSSQTGSVNGDAQPASHSFVEGRVSRSSTGSVHTADSDSFEYVEFEKARTSLDSSSSPRSGMPSQSSAMHDSMQDSLHYLPLELRHKSLSLEHSHDMENLPSQKTGRRPTTLTARREAGSSRDAELVDYFATDRYCETVPCWVSETQTNCPLHTEAIRRPMLLFCLQVLDEFIASTSTMRGECGLVVACRLARVVFARWWEQDILGLCWDPDILIADFVSQRKSVAGVSLDVWRIIESCWNKHQQNYFHHQELHFPEINTSQGGEELRQWRRIREWLQVYGVRPNQAKLLHADRFLCMETPTLSSDQVELVGRGYPSTTPLEVGCTYWTAVLSSGNRHIIGQEEWKLAFSIIDKTIKKGIIGADVYSCGPFPRGAAYGSVIDVVVALPDEDAREATLSVDDVMEALIKATIVRRQGVTKLSLHRSVAVVEFRNCRLLLDLKAYCRPQTFFAVLYFTGPETFTRVFFSKFIKQELSALSIVDFDHIYERAVEVHGLGEVSAIESEHHIFALVDCQYVEAPHRI